ncbi:MAG: hypothetical protein ABI068_10550, partial [Ktedonobacterales bacterium]
HALTRVRRRWDTAQTPYQRLLATGTLTEATRQRFQTLYAQTNPLALRQRIYDQLAALRTLTDGPTAGPSPPPPAAA